MSLVFLVFAASLLLWTTLLHVRVAAPLGFALLVPRLTAAALSPWLLAAGVLGGVLGWALSAPLGAALSGVAAGLALLALWRVHGTRGDFTAAFGPDWERAIPPERGARMLPRRWSWRLPAPAQVRWERDVAFASVPGTGRPLLADLWLPPEGAPGTGLAYVYLHGSAWYALDKDAFTRRLFRHLASQGHVVMDVAYRLYPEADVPAMVGDVKRAVAWLKAHAAHYGVSPAHVVLGGGSAGGHLAQLAAFAPHHLDLTPEELRGRDLSVRGVVSLYGPSDLAACFRHTRQDRIPGVGSTPPDLELLSSPAPAALVRLLGPSASRLGLHKLPVAGRLDWLMGGTPEQVPGAYAVCSPIHHVHPGCPPTLLLQGEEDLITPVGAARELCARLRELGVPVIQAFYPHTDHGFDLTLPTCSPSAQAALYEVERFLAVLAEGAAGASASEGAAARDAA